MKSAILCFLIFSVTLIEIQGGKIFDQNDAKSKAKKEVTEKQKKINDQLKEIVSKYVEESKKDINPKVKEDFNNKGKEKFKEYNDKFANEGITALKTAIEKNKPLSAYECVIKVTSDGRDEFKEILDKYENSLSETENKRIKELNNTVLLSSLIEFGLEKTIADTLMAIEKADKTKDIDTHKAAGIKKCENAEIQAKNLKQRVLDLKKMESLYEDVLKAMNEKLASALKSYTTKIQNCVK